MKKTALLAAMFLLLFIQPVFSAPSNSPLYYYSGSYSGTLGLNQERTETISNNRYVDALVFHLKKYDCCMLCTGVSASISGTSMGTGEMSAGASSAERWVSARGQMPIGEHEVAISYDCNYEVEIYEPLMPPLAITGDGESSTIAVDFPQRGAYRFDFGLESGEYTAEFDTGHKHETINVKTPKSSDIEIDGGMHTIEINTVATQNTRWSLTISAPMSCSGTCPSGQQQKPAPDCSCYMPTCEPPCPTGKAQKPYPDCSCYVPEQQPPAPQQPSSGEETTTPAGSGACTNTCSSYELQRPYPECSCEPDRSCKTNADCLNKGMGNACMNQKCESVPQGGGGCLLSSLIVVLLLAGALFVKRN